MHNEDQTNDFQHQLWESVAGTPGLNRKPLIARF